VATRVPRDSKGRGMPGSMGKGETRVEAEDGLRKAEMIKVAEEEGGNRNSRGEARER
jgi:hypothetical protein